MLTSVVDAMKKYIQIAKPKSRRYFIQDAILKPLFLKVRILLKHYCNEITTCIP